LKGKNEKQKKNMVLELLIESIPKTCVKELFSEKPSNNKKFVHRKTTTTPSEKT